MVPSALTGQFKLSPVRMTENHKNYARYLKDPAVSIILATGPPGTSKTLSAMCAGVSALRHGDVRRLLITRPMIAAEAERLAQAPPHAQMTETLGVSVAKTRSVLASPYFSPCSAMLDSEYDAAVLERLIGDGSIMFVPLGLLSGATFLHEFVIADEVQNASVGQVRTLLTRVGEGSKLVLTGDIAQNDMIYESGLADFAARLHLGSGVKSIKHVEFTNSDLVRDPVVAEVLRLYKL
jgi:phosphate starvation-inducible PhoH-like protein